MNILRRTTLRIVRNCNTIKFNNFYLINIGNKNICSSVKKNLDYKFIKAHRYYFGDKLPKHKKLTMPALSPTMTQGKIMEWFKKEGDKISSGDVLASVETDKAAVDFETNDEGYLAKIIYPKGSSDISLGTPIAILVDDIKDVQAFNNYSGENKTVEEPKIEKKETPKPTTQQNTGKKYPKHKKLTMPALSPTMTEGKIVEWNKKEGDKINSGDVLASVETDKAAVDFETNDEGYLAKIIFPKGSGNISLGTAIAIIVDDSKDVESFKNYSVEETSSTSGPAIEQTVQSKSEKVELTRSNDDRIFASPLAKKTASEKGINLLEIKGTGPNNRVIQADVLEHKSTPKVEVTKPVEVPIQVQKVESPQVSDILTQQFEDLELTSVRKAIADRLLFSKTNIPHFYLGIECNVDKLLSLRVELNKHSSVKISINDMIIKAASIACIKVPEANSSWQGKFIRKYKNVDMSVAVQTDYGLITPIITNSNLKGLAEISKEMKELAEKAKLRKLKPQEFQGGTFTISNLGMMGITNFSAIINPPQSCIIAVGKSEKRVVYDENAVNKEQPFKVVSIMCATLSCDHRVVDGAVGAKWVQEFKNLIENPELMLL